MAKRIVAKFNKDFDKIEFYEIMDDYSDFTIIRKQGTQEYYAWDNKYSVLSGNLHIISLPEDRDKMYEILKNCEEWYYGLVFFWADSKFVTEYGLPNYEKLVDIYKQLINIKITEFNVQQTLKEVWENENLIVYIKTKLLARKLLKAQKQTVKKLEKEFKIIW